MRAASHRILIPLGLVAALAFGLAMLTAAMPAQAKLPKTNTKLIVPGQSVGGVKLGMSMARAGQIWKMPQGLSCFDMQGDGSLTCMFEVLPSSANYHTGNISYRGRKKVESISMRMPVSGSDVSANLKRPLLKFKTSRKLGSIGLDSTAGKLRSAFGSKLKVVYAKSGVIVYQYRGPKTAKTDFVVEGGKSGRVVTISMYRGKSKY